MSRWSMVLAGGAALALIAGCCCGGSKTDSEWEEALDKAFDEALEEAVNEVAESGGEVAEKAGTTGSGACADYSRCCSDYIDALATLPGYPAESVEMAKEGCTVVEQLQGTPGGDEACKTSLDALKQGMEGMTAFPGWKSPASCQ